MAEPADLLPAEIEREELRAYGRRLAEIEWLMIALVLLYLQLSDPTQVGGLLGAVLGLAVFVLIFHYAGLQRLYGRRWPLLLDVAAMSAFSTAVIFMTGGAESPLLALYFLVVGASSLVLPQWAAFSITAALTAAAVAGAFIRPWGSSGTLSQLAISLFALWLVAFLTARLSREKQSARLRVHLLSRTDDLTGLWNMRMFEEQAEQEHRRSLRYERPYSIAMVDADNLKPVNDRYGHQAGSRFICHLAAILRDNLRGSDLVARYGGDEFVILLPETGRRGAVRAFQRIRQRVADEPLQLTEDTVSLSVSVGIASFPGHGDSHQAILTAADQALYRSKRTGKNRISYGTRDASPPEAE
ncbi:MAG TPA: GGDEF domain-containing protein [Acidobacteriota bacterium]|nr:GGDEF domain-containing protein [Acidobacteriota bacterium]